MGRRATYDHRHTSHRNISMPPSRALAIRRAAAVQGLSSHTWIQQAISAGLCLFGVAEVEDSDADE